MFRALKTLPETCWLLKLSLWSQLQPYLNWTNLMLLAHGPLCTESWLYTLELSHLLCQSFLTNSSGRPLPKPFLPFKLSLFDEWGLLRKVLHVHNVESIGNDNAWSSFLLDWTLYCLAIGGGECCDYDLGEMKKEKNRLFVLKWIVLLGPV